MSAALTLVDSKGEPRLDTRLLASQLELQHASVFKTVGDYRADFEQLGKVRFEIGPLPGSRTGQKGRFALLNEDQCYLLLAFSRNTDAVRALKVKLVKAFRQARDARQQDAAEYLPTYHAVHDLIAAKAAASSNERAVHINFNKLINKTVGIAAGERSGLPAPRRSLLIVAQDIATRALAAAKDHHDGYQGAKQALGALERVLLDGPSRRLAA